MNDDTNETSNDYLWDRTGEPDPLVAALERKLSPLAESSAAAAVSSSAAAAASSRAAGARRATAHWRGALLVAALALATVAPFVWFAAPRSAAPAGESYEIALRSGAARVTRPSATRAEDLTPGASQHFPVGTSLVCDANATVTLNVGRDSSGADLGEVTVEGPSTLRLDASSDELKKLYLHQGSLRARISATAKQRLFQVGTPVGNAVDLGCVYTMKVHDDHTTLLRVQVGRVAFEIGKKIVYIWSGARCAVDAARGPGLPVDEGAEPAFARAAENWSSAADETQRSAALAELARLARRDDAATLWHVVAHSNNHERGAAVAKLEALSPAPPLLARASLVAGDPAALESWRADIMGW